MKITKLNIPVHIKTGEQTQPKQSEKSSNGQSTNSDSKKDYFERTPNRKSLNFRFELPQASNSRIPKVEPDRIAHKTSIDFNDSDKRINIDSDAGKQIQLNLKSPSIKVDN